MSDPKANTEERVVRTTLALPEGLMSDARRATGAKTKRETVLRALQAVVRQEKQDEFRARIGTFRLGMTREELLRWREME